MSADLHPSRPNVIVIGAGLAGLSAACLLARRGVGVTVLEANEKPGGCCATTTVDGYTFHDGAVYVAAVRLVDSAFARLGLDRAAVVPLRRVETPFSIALPDGARITLGEGLSLEAEGCTVDRTRVQAELARLLHKWQPVYDVAVDRFAAAPFSPWRTLAYGWKHLHKLRGTVASEMRRLVSDEHVRSALTGTLLHMGVGPAEMPAASMVGLAAILSEGLLLPEGGMGSIPDALAAALLSEGAQLHRSSPVTRIIVDRGRATGVQIAGAERLDAAAIISTVSPMETFTSLVDREHVPPYVTRRVDRARLSHRAVSVQLGLRRRIETRALMTMVLPMMEQQHEVVAQDPRAVAWPVYSVPTMALPHLAPAGGSIVETFVPVASEASLAAHDGRSRQEIVESTVRTLRRFHDIDVAVSRVRTPTDFRDQMHLYKGALYGLSPVVAPQEQFGQTSAIDGLFLAGQSTYPGYGVGAAMMSGIFAAEAAIASALPRRSVGAPAPVQEPL